MPLEVQSHRLENGLTVLLHQARTVPLISLWAWYHVGSKNERPGLTGISHWVEHMNFKGTEGIPKEEMKALVERAGGVWNGYTWIDQTAYFETTRREALPEVLRLEAERMARCVYDPLETETERTVIISELHGAENDPHHLLEIEVVAAAIKAHPYHWPTIGWLSDLQTMTREDLFEYYHRYYVPSNTVLALVGDFEADEALDRIATEFGALPPGEPLPVVRTREPEQEGERRVVIRREGTTSYVALAYPAPAFSDPGFYPFLVLDGLLAGGKGINLWSNRMSQGARHSSPLYRHVVGSGLASEVSTQLLPTEHPYLYFVWATVQAGRNPSKVEGALRDVVEGGAGIDWSEEAVERARHQLRAAFAFDMDSVTKIGHQLGYFETIADHRDFLRFGENLDTVDLDDVRRTASTCLGETRRTTGRYVPLEGTND